jgi:hypothetical protein
MQKVITSAQTADKAFLINGVCPMEVKDRKSLFIHSQALIVQDGPLASLFGVGLLWASYQPVAETTYTGQHNRQTSMPRAGFEPAIPATKRPQTYSLDCAATGIGLWSTLNNESSTGPQDPCPAWYCRLFLSVQLIN